MQACYADQAHFSDSAFVNLDNKEVKAMWEMLVKTGKDMSLSFSNVRETESGGSADWTATYLFSRTGNHVVNHVHSEFVIENGLIVSQTDHFDFYKWSRQAFGFTGLLLGWTPYFKSKVQNTAKQSLHDYMKKNNL